ncbi:MAG: FHA domain-containing protein [Myxococcales bacterium]|nr:FHA domain-containing protein [Myxococcales bacterium]MCB9716055.1 FHA domain-containing protein [Myxococcales bacterium]
MARAKPEPEGGPTVEYHEPELAELGHACLEVVRGVPFGKPLLLSAGSLLVGRDETAEIRLDVSGVSRKHARLTVEAGTQVRLTDLGSRNGTFVNAQRIESVPLREGDELRFGPAVLRLRFIGRDAPPPPAPAPSRPPELSVREFEVACLVAEGLTNAEVGKRLFISPATVGRHLSNVYERLGIHSRAALTRYISDPSSRDR